MKTLAVYCDGTCLLKCEHCGRLERLNVVLGKSINLDTIECSFCGLTRMVEESEEVVI